jgi:hypothetical protein
LAGRFAVATVDFEVLWSAVVLKRLLAPLLLGAVATATATAITLPAAAAVDNDLPVRWNTGGAVWSTNQDAFATFLSTGEVTDRGLKDGLARSGWTAEEIRAGMTKTYDVNLVGVARFLYSDAGVKFLKQATLSYFPYWSMNTYAVPALRSAIVADAADGSISSAGIMKALPTDFRLADFCNTYTGRQNICSEGRCQEGSAQCTSLLSWYVFLPACIQANQIATPAAAAATTPPPSGVRALW